MTLFLVQDVLSSATKPTRVEISRRELDERLLAYQNQMRRLPEAREIRMLEEQVVEDALWFEQAWSLGLQKDDAIVQQRLVLNMRFLDGESDRSDADLVAQAVELGMDRSDPVVRRRLVDRVQAMIRAGVESQIPDEDALRAYYEIHSEEWREPALLDLTHVYFSRDKRAGKAERDAQILAQKLTSQSIDPDAAVEMADPFLAGHRLRGATPNQIIARLGPDFAADVENAPVHRWLGPIPSAFGTHLVWIHDKIESRIAPFENVRSRVVADWVGRETEKALRTQIERRKRVVEVVVIEDRQAPPTSAKAAGGG